MVGAGRTGAGGAEGWHKGGLGAVVGGLDEPLSYGRLRVGGEEAAVC